MYGLHGCGEGNALYLSGPAVRVSDSPLGECRGVFPEAADDVDSHVAPEVRQDELVHVGAPQSGKRVT